MECPRLSDLPPPPAGRSGWPWTEESPRFDRPGSESPPRVSVVVPSYQQGRFLEETLRSILLQGYPDLELVIMDGGSTDGTVPLIHKYAPWIASWVSARDGGQSAAINAGWRRATGELLTWLNSDDLLMPGSVTNTVQPFLADPSLDVAYSECRIIDVESRFKWMFPAHTPNLEDMLVYWHMPFAQQGYLMRRRVLETCGYLREDLHFCMDVEYVARMLLRHCTFTRVEGVGGAFRIHDSGKTTTHHSIHVKDMIDVINQFCETAPPEFADLVPRARARLHWSAAHAKYDGRSYADARTHALRHLHDAGWRVLPRVSGMVALSYLGEPGHRLLAKFRRLKSAAA